MSKTSPLYCLLLIILTYVSAALAADNLIATLSSVKIPDNVSATSCYDGKDTVYIMGGGGAAGLYVDTIAAYTVSTDTIRVVGHLPVAISDGLCSISPVSGKVYYIAGFSASLGQQSNIYEFDPETGLTTLAGSALTKTSDGHAIYPIGDKAIAFTSSDYYSTLFNVSEWDMETHTTKKLHDIPIQLYAGSTAIAYDGVDTIYLFGHYSQGPQVVKYSIKDKISDWKTIRNFPCDEYGYFDSGASAIFDGESFFIMKGNNNCTTGLLKYNPINDEVTFHPVESAVDGDNWIGIATSSIYVPGLNRIYNFGTFSSRANRRDEIMWLDLTPINNTEPEPGFSCLERPDGAYSYEGDCTRYWLCRSEQAFEAACPSPLLFNESIGECDLPQNVDCAGGFCYGKSDGVYPLVGGDLSDCDKFVGCKDGVKNVFLCPEPLVFDKEERQCNYPHLVTC